MGETLSGGTTNLLRMARSGCQSAVAFVALSLGDQRFATATYPADLGDGPPFATGVEGLVRQLWLEPGLAQGKALVRTVQLGGRPQDSGPSRLAVAALPLGVAGGSRPSGVLGVADPDAKSFGLPELELLSRIAQRLTSYVQARRTVRAQLAGAVPSGAGTDGRGAGIEGDEESERHEEPSPPTPTISTFPTVVPDQPPDAGPAAVTAPVVAPAVIASGTLDPLGALLGGGSVPGLVPLGALLGLAGRFLGAGSAARGSLSVIALTVDGMAQPGAGVMEHLVQSLRTDLRFDDPLASIGGLSFVAVVPLSPGGASSEQVEARLVDRAREAVASHPGAVVRAAHVVAPLSAGHDADELLRAAVGKLRAA